MVMGREPMKVTQFLTVSRDDVGEVSVVDTDHSHGFRLRFMDEDREVYVTLVGDAALLLMDRLSEKYEQSIRPDDDESEWAPYYSEVFTDDEPAEVDAFINVRLKTVRALSRGDWVDVGGAWHQIAKAPERDAWFSDLRFTDGTGLMIENNAWLTTGDRVTDCEGSVMPESSDAWDVVS